MQPTAVRQRPLGLFTGAGCKRAVRVNAAPGGTAAHRTRPELGYVRPVVIWRSRGNDACHGQARTARDVPRGLAAKHKRIGYFSPYSRVLDLRRKAEAVALRLANAGVPQRTNRCDEVTLVCGVSTPCPAPRSPTIATLITNAPSPRSQERDESAGFPRCVVPIRNGTQLALAPIGNDARARASLHHCRSPACAHFS